MQRYFVKDFDYDETNHHYTDTFTLSEDDTYHLKTVMRKTIGDLVEIICKGEAYICRIINDKQTITCIVIDVLESNHNLIPSVTIAQSLVKEQKMDYILQKSTELGVSNIIPLKVNRSLIKIDKKDNKKIYRWNKIVKEASEQSKRLDIPKVENIMDINDLIKLEYDYKLLCSVNETSTTIKRVLQNVNSSDTILIVIGPEGGFEKQEEEKLTSNGFISVTLGSRVLRTETASAFVLSIINYIFEE